MEAREVKSSQASLGILTWGSPLLGGGGPDTSSFNPAGGSSGCLGVLWGSAAVHFYSAVPLGSGVSSGQSEGCVVAA